jgi:uncharacterized protein (DUF302 family)
MPFNNPNQEIFKMNKLALPQLLAGGVIGIIITAIALFFTAPSMMMVVDESQYDFDQSIAKIRESAAGEGWKVPTVHMLHQAVAGDGYVVGRAGVIELCQPHHAARILADESSRFITSMMPCRVSIYETSDGKVLISRMNTGLVAQLFGGLIAEVMAVATAENEKILAALLR